MSTEAQQPHSAEIPEPPEIPSLPDAPEMVRALADPENATKGKHFTQDEEKGAIYWLLQKQRAPRYAVEVSFDTPEGQQQLVWTLKAIPGDEIDRIERTNTDDRTGRMDDLQINAETVAIATAEVRDKTGASLDIRAEPFLGGMPTAGSAIKARFHYQSGVLAGIASRVREISGWGPDRVGSANRVVVDLVQDSSGSED